MPGCSFAFCIEEKCPQTLRKPFSWYYRRHSYQDCIDNRCYRIAGVRRTAARRFMERLAGTPQPIPNYAPTLYEGQRRFCKSLTIAVVVQFEEMDGWRLSWWAQWNSTSPYGRRG